MDGREIKRIRNLYDQQTKTMLGTGGVDVDVDVDGVDGRDGHSCREMGGA